MKLSLLSISVLALALCAGCADTYHPHTATVTTTTTMGAGPASGTVCQDGTLLPPNSRCALHGGVSRQTTYVQTFPSYW